MKNYKYESITYKNKSLLMVEMVFDDLTFESINVYPIVRLTHYRYVLTQRINSISDFLYSQITNGSLNPATVSIQDIISIRDIAYAKKAIRHIHITYTFDKSIVIAEYDWMYMMSDSRDNEIFKVLKTETKHPDEFRYTATKNGSHVNCRFHAFNNISMRDYNKMDTQRIHHLLHFKEIVA